MTDATMELANFGQLAAEMRPRLHRYCARMVGSALDGEDVVQEALAKAAEARPSPARLNARKAGFSASLIIPRSTPCDAESDRPRSAQKSISATWRTQAARPMCGLTQRRALRLS